MAQLQRGIADFATNELITNTKLHQLIDLTTVLYAIIFDQATKIGSDVDVANDYILWLDTSTNTLFKILFNQIPGVAGAQPNPTWTVLTDGATITQTCDTAKVVQNAKVTLGGNRTLAISSPVNGQTGVIVVKQDGTGGRTLTLPAGSFIPGSGSSGTGPADLITTANRETVCAWVYNGTNFYWTFTKY